MRVWWLIMSALVLGCGAAAQQPTSGPPRAGASDGGPSGPMLDGHEAQLFGSPFPYCRTFIVGFQGDFFVVVGSDAVARGDHDCLLDREVRYLADWGDGVTSATDFERCDVRVPIDHAYGLGGTFSLTVVAEDHQGQRTRSRTYPITVVQSGLDLMASSGNYMVEADRIRFEMTVENRGNVPAGPFRVAYPTSFCAGPSVISPGPEIGSRRIDGLAPLERRSWIEELIIPPGVVVDAIGAVVDADGEVPEVCKGRATDGSDNDLTGAALRDCPIGGVP